MDDELKVVVTSVLEADEDASAQRIVAQLPSISEKVNSKSNIKIGVELERNAAQYVTQQISRELSKASRHAVGISVNLDSGSIQKFQSELDKLGVNDKITRAISAEMDSMGVRIDQITGAWKEAADGERQLLNLTIQGTDQLGRKVAIAKQFAYTLDEETAELKEQSSTITRMTADLEKQRQAEARLAAQEKKDNQQRLNDVAAYETSLQKLQALYTGDKGTKPLTDQSHLDDVIAKYGQIEAAVASLKAKQGAASEEEKRGIETQISELELLIQKYQNVEYVATKLRTKTVVQVNTEQVERLKEFEERLRSAGILTKEFQERIVVLQSDLGQAFDNKSLTDYLNGFDRLQSDAASFQEKIRSINFIYSDLGKVANEIGAIQRELVGLNPTDDASRISALKEQLAIYEQQKSQLEGQLVPYQSILEYAKQKTVYEQQAKILAGELAIAEAAVSDNAAKIDTAMERVPSTVDAIRARFSQLANPTQELVQRVSQLDAEMRAVSDAKTDQEKIAAYKKLAETIKYCRTEITSLSVAQHKDILDVKFTSGLEKAKADLATIARTWSAFKSDPGLNAQFQQLSANLKRVNSQADLTKWTAQFNAFKSEVKAAGLNVQSLGDTLKNNLGKVLQWVSATTLLFRAFRLLKTAVSTVIDLDTAMVDLRKVTSATTEEYQEFYHSANDTAKALNATTEAVISQTAEWARLGYSMQDAAKLAENSMIFAAVSPGMDQATATDGLVSIIKAYGIEVEDTMDGIISKVNDVGNKFAVSNADIVEALTRSSSAMAAANNTFEETVALATAAIEITRDANTVGNALKTLSMRIRGYDEETEEYSEDIAILTGKIADFTKTASNPSGITLFTDETNQTYRSTYEILSDIADIWDEIEDVNQARLLENLFGKRQAQVGSAILSNFDQARKSIETMANSAGSAEREMEKVMDSLDYRINALKETWTGVAQNLFQSDSLKAVIDVLQTLSNIVDAITEKLGLFGTVTLAGLIGWVVQVGKSFSSLNAAVSPVVQTLANTSFDGTAASTMRYAAAIEGLDAAQKQTALSMAGLNAEQRQQVLSMEAAIAAASQYTLAELQEKFGIDGETIAKRLNITATQQLTSEILRSAVAMGLISEKQLQAIVTTNTQTAAIGAQSLGWKGLAASMKAATAAMLTNPLGWVTLLIGVLPLAISLVQKFTAAQEETRRKAIELGNAAATESKEISELVNDFIDLSEAVKTDDSAKKDLLKTQDKLIDKLGIEKGKLEELVKEYGNLSDAVKAASIESLQETERDLRGRINARKEELEDSVGGSFSTGYTSPLSIVSSYYADKDRDTQIVNYNALKALEDKGYISSSSYSSYTDKDGSKYSQGFAISVASDEDLKTVEGILAAYEKLGAMLDVVSKAAGSQNDVYDKLYGLYADMTDAVKNYRSAISDYNTNLAEQYMLQELIGRDIPKTQEEFDSYRQSVIDTAVASKEFAGATEDDISAVEQAVDTVLSNQSQFADFMRSNNAAIDSGTNSTASYTAKLKDLSEVLTGLQSAYNLVEKAQEDMSDGGGLSPETIKALADAEENYLDYLYEENGVVKLNTDAWIANANAKMRNEMGEIQKEIDALEAQNDELRETIALYGDIPDSWAYQTITDATAKINENTAAIARNQAKLALYGSLYGSITGDLDAYTTALNDFSNIHNVIDDVSSSFQTLADLQAQVADGFTMSLDKALEFASVYPEILNNATVAADGQIALNEGVVNTFLEGKQAELTAQIDAQINQLEADKAVLEAKKALAEAQLSLAENVGEGEGKIAKDVAEYRLNASNALTQALIDNGVSEADAYALAAAAMAEDEEEFARVAMKAFENMDENAAKAAYSMAQSILVNAQSSAQSIADIAKQSHQTAIAIAAMGRGVVSGSANVVGVGGGGRSGGGVSLDLYHGDFEGASADYKAATVSLEDYVSQLELDISAYTNAIAQIDGQIAALQALKNIPLDHFSSDYGSNSSSSGGSGSATKDIEEYIATLDDYREALERLAKARQTVAEIERKISDSSDPKEKLILERELIDAYKREQEALHNLNNQRDSTIHAGVNALRELGFEVSYNDDTNELWIANMEHINELVADNAGEYGTLQEATNALRKETEDLIESLTDLNEANQDGSEEWWELRSSIIKAREEIQELLKEIVKEASEAVDSMQDVYDTLHSAADEYADTGYVTIDTLQKIIDLGIEYVSYLQDEDGQLVINEERIRAVVAAKTEELAIESSMSYIAALRIAQENEDIETLNRLLYATEQATDATWGLVYANLQLLGLNDEQYNAALNNINAIRALAENAIQGIGQVGHSVKDELQDMKDGLDDILKYVMDMLKQRINDQIDALEDEKDAYQAIIDKQKESLKTAEKELSYKRTVADKVKEIAKLQAQIAALERDDSREAQQERAALMEELAKLQEDLADEQSDHAREAQEDALDDMQKAYEEEKDAEIAALEESISSYQKLYDMAIEYIQNNWNTLYNELIAWNTEYGSVLNSEITTAWDNALAAAQRYGSYVAALGSIDADIDAAGTAGQSTVVGSTYYSDTATNAEMVKAIVSQMKAYAAQWSSSNTKSLNDSLHEKAALAAAKLDQYGVHASFDSAKGVWTITRDDINPGNVGKLLYNCYHAGGIVGGGSIKANEEIALLKDREWVLSERMVDNLSAQIERIRALTASFNTMPDYVSKSALLDFLRADGTRHSISNVTNNSSGDISIDVPVQIFPLQKFDEEEIGNLTDRISDSTIRRIYDTFVKRGISTKLRMI